MKSHKAETLTVPLTLCVPLPRLQLLLFDLIGYHGQLSLELGGGSVSACKIVEGLPGGPQGADEAVLQVRAHPGEALLQL